MPTDLSAGRHVLLGLALAALLAGCSRSLPEKADPDKARAWLQTALDAWKNGDPPENLAKGSPAIFFNDPRYKAGQKLTAYQLEEAHDFHGQSARINATLTLQAKDGAATEKKTAYLIDIGNGVVIVPD